MVYIFTAFYAEAKMLIRHYALKKGRQIDGLKFDFFENDKIRLIITGVGAAAASTSVGNAGAIFHIGRDDIIINIGSAASCKCDGAVIGNEIIDDASERTFYPDMLIKCELPEVRVVAVGRAVTNTQSIRNNDTVYDMEASAIYQAASFFVGPHQMAFVKVISDAGERIDSKKVETVFDEHEEAICKYVDTAVECSDKLSDSMRENMRNGMRDNVHTHDNTHDNTQDNRQDNTQDNAQESLSYLGSKDIDTLADDLKCSKVMTDQLRQLILYLNLSGVEYKTVIDKFYQYGQLPCKSKKEGKACLEKLKEKLL